jgi:chromosome partitioning protein
MNRVAGFAEGLADRDIVPLGTVINMYRTGTTVHENTLRALRRDAMAGKVPPLFQSLIPYASTVEGAAEFAKASTLRQRWGYQGHFNQLNGLATELNARSQEQL